MSTQEPPTGGIAIGVLLPFSGRTADEGPRLERGLILAKDQLNELGAADGIQFRLSVRDPNTARDRLPEALAEMQDMIALVGPGEVELVLAAQAYLQDSDTPYLLPSSATIRDFDATAVNPVFHMAPPGEVLGCALGERIYRDGIERVAVVHADDALSRAFADGLVVAYESRGATGFEGDAQAIPLTADRTGVLSAIVEFDAQAIAVVAGTEEAAALMTDWSSIDRAAQWYLAPALITEELIRNTPPGATEGALGVSIALPDDAPDFAAIYRDRWNGEEPFLGAYYYYDAALLVGLSTILAARELGRTPTSGEIRPYIASLANPPGTNVTWRDLAGVLERAQAGTDVNFTGASGALTVGAGIPDLTTSPLFQMEIVRDASFSPDSFTICSPGALDGL